MGGESWREEGDGPLEAKGSRQGGAGDSWMFSLHHWLMSVVEPEQSCSLEVFFSLFRRIEGGHGENSRGGPKSEGRGPREAQRRISRL